MVRQDVNEAISQALTWRQFLQCLSQKGYTFRFNRKYPTLQPPGKSRPIRFKTLGKQYTPEAIKQRILYSQKSYPAEPHVHHARLHGTYQKARKLKGLRVFYYCSSSDLKNVFKKKLLEEVMECIEEAVPQEKSRSSSRKHSSEERTRD